MPRHGLHRLIHSLSKAQKRHFKLYVGEKGGKPANYMRLFEAIDRQPEGDDESLSRRLRGTRMLKHLASEKNYLFELILKAMRPFDADKSVDGRLRAYLQDIEFLHRVHLLDLAMKRVRKARKEAERFEKYLALLELLEWEGAILPHAVAKGLDAREAEMAQERSDLLARYNQLTRLESCRNTLYRLRRLDPRGTDADGCAKAEAVWQELCSEALTHEMTFLMRSRYLAAAIYYHNHFRRLDEALKLNLELLELWESRPDFIREQVPRFKGVIQNCMALGSQLRDFSRYPELLERYKQLPSDSAAGRVQDFQNIHKSEVLYYLNTMNWDALRERAPELDRLLQRLPEIDPGSVMLYHYNVGLYHFFVEEWEACHDRMKKVMNQPAEPDRISSGSPGGWRWSFIMRLPSPIR